MIEAQQFVRNSKGILNPYPAAMEHRYFSMKEFMAFAVEVTSQVKLRWLAFSGDVLNESDSAELQQLLEEFFRRRNHSSFRKHGS